MFDWFRKLMVPAPLTAKQKDVLDRFLASNISPKALTTLDQAMSLFIIIWGTVWASYLFFVGNVLRIQNAQNLGTFVSILNLTVGGYMWCSYKAAQWRNSIDLRILAFGIFFLYLDTLVVSGFFVIAEVFLVLLGFLLSLSTDFVVATGLLLAFLLGLLWGFVTETHSTREVDWIMTLFRKGRRRYPGLATSSDEVYPEDVAAEIANRLAKTCYSIWLTSLLSLLNILTVFTVVTIAASQTAILQTPNGLLLLALILMLLVAGIASVMVRRRWEFSRAYERVHRLDLT